MSGSLEGNKIVAAVLAAGVVAMISGFVATLVYHPETLDKPVYSVAVEEAEPAAADAAAAPAMSLGGLLAAADAEAGKKQAKKCTACHSFDEGGPTKIGPNLWNVLNRPIASVAGFGYSSVLQGMSGETWSYENLDAFMANPKGFAAGTKMSFGGVKKEGARADLIMFLRSFSGSPADLPQ